MKTFAMAAVAAALLATPVVSAYAYPDAETADGIAWQQVVDQANANRLGIATTVQNQGDVAAVKANQANDAAQAPKAAVQAQPVTHNKYNNVLEIHDDN